MIELITGKFTKISIFVASNLPTPKAKSVELLQTVYVSGIKRDPFTLTDYVRLMNPFYDGIVIRSGGIRRCELNIFAAGRKCGKSIAQSQFFER